MAKDNRVTIRFEQGVKDSLETMATDLNMNFNHFCSISLSLGAKSLHRQQMAFENIPDSVWHSMALGFAQGMDEEKMMQALISMWEDDPEKFRQMMAKFDAVEVIE